MAQGAGTLREQHPTLTILIFVIVLVIFSKELIRLGYLIRVFRGEIPKRHSWLLNSSPFLPCLWFSPSDNLRLIWHYLIQWRINEVMSLSELIAKWFFQVLLGSLTNMALATYFYLWLVQTGLPDMAALSLVNVVFQFVWHIYSLISSHRRLKKMKKALTSESSTAEPLLSIGRESDQSLFHGWGIN